MAVDFGSPTSVLPSPCAPSTTESRIIGGGKTKPKRASITTDSSSELPTRIEGTASLPAEGGSRDKALLRRLPMTTTTAPSSPQHRATPAAAAAADGSSSAPNGLVVLPVKGEKEDESCRVGSGSPPRPQRPLMMTTTTTTVPSPPQPPPADAGAMAAPPSLPNLVPPLPPSSSSKRRAVSDSTATATRRSGGVGGGGTPPTTNRSVAKVLLVEPMKRRVLVGTGGAKQRGGNHKNDMTGSAAPAAVAVAGSDATTASVNRARWTLPPRRRASAGAKNEEVATTTTVAASTAMSTSRPWLDNGQAVQQHSATRAGGNDARVHYEEEFHRGDAETDLDDYEDPPPTAMESVSDEPALLVVYFMERNLRVLLGLMAAYLVGIRHGTLMAQRQEQHDAEAAEGDTGWDSLVLVAWVAKLAMEYVAVAWATCVLILIGTRIVYRRRTRSGANGGGDGGRQHQLSPLQRRSRRNEADEGRMDWAGRRKREEVVHSPTRRDFTLPLHADYAGEATPLLARAVVDMEPSGNYLDTHQAPYSSYGGDSSIANHPRVASVDQELAPAAAPAEEDEQGLFPPALSRKPTTPSVVMPHPALDSLYIMDMMQKTRIVPNDVENLYEISSEYFEGRMLALIRTPDVDAAAVVGSAYSANHAARQYLKDKQRRFEFQFQVRLKKVPTGRVYFGVQVNDPVKLGVIQRAFVSAAMAFVRTTNPNFHYSFGTTSTAAKPNSNGNLVGLNGDDDNDSESNFRSKPIMAFPVEEGMNRVVITPPGQTPPALGGEIYEDPEAMKRRRKGVDWNLVDTYTLAAWSAYVDFLDWRCLNLPGIRPFQLEGVVGVQPMTMVLFEDAPGGKMNKIIDLELSNVMKSVVGPVAQEWMASTATLTPMSVPPTLEAREVEAVAPPELETPDVEEPVDAIEEEKLAALGEGIYVESGDKIVLRELLPQKSAGDDASDKSCFVTYAGGFCVLQENSSSTIVIEKVGRRRKGFQVVQSRLIKSGDAVMFRLLTKKADGTDESRYLSIHRGWWLKWVPHVPTKNGVFTIHTHEFECSDHEKDNLDSAAGPEETQQSYLTWGNSFYLRHKRWSKYEVGVAGSVSSTYGGRLLGLYSSKGNYDDDFGQFDELESQGDAGSSDPLTVERGKDKEWMKPLQLRAFEAAAETISPSVSWGLSGEDLIEASRSEDKVLTFSSDALRMDVPAWIEVLNRKDRVLQLTYAVRVSPQAWFDESAKSDDDEPVQDAFVRFRTGRQLSHLMRAGQQWRTNTSPRRNRSQGAELDDTQSSSPAKVATPPRNRPSSQEIASAPPHSEEQEVLLEDDSDSSSSMSGDWLESGEDLDTYRQGDNDPQFNAVGEPSSRTKRKLRRRKIIGTIASKSKTVVRTGVKVGKDTGKSVVRSSVMVGKGTVNAGKATVNAGKAIIAPIAKQRTLNEPTPSKGPGLMTKKRKEKDFGAAVTRSMKRFDRMASRHSAAEAPVVIAGELSALEQSCRTVSSMLTRMSSLSPSDAMCERFSSVLAQEVAAKSDQDAWFLSGSAVQLGVALSASEKRQKLVHDCVVARCLWESHWREEWCGIFETTVTFYQPLSNSPCLELLIDDIQSVREVHDSRCNPLPGFYLLALETAWMCRYVAFTSIEKRSAFASSMQDVLTRAADKRTNSVVNEKAALWEARLWQDFASSAKSSEGKWAKVVSGIHQKSRLVLNNRRMVFDLPPPSDNPVEFVSDLLSTSLSFSKLAHLKEHPELLVAFLDATSQLRRLPLQDFDLTSAAAFCFFVNLYHCLLQHALLLSVNGPLTKRSFGHFMRTSCYELGGDVFSLAELHACVIRGNMTRPVTSKPPAVEVSKASNSYRYYALGYTNPRVNFVLSTGDVASPPDVTILSPDQFLSQLNEASASYLRHYLTVDVSKRLVVLPKVCDVYRHDFCATSLDGNAASSSPLTAGLACLRYCLPLLDADQASAVKLLLQDEASIVIRYYQPASEQYRTALRQKDYPD